MLEYILYIFSSLSGVYRPQTIDEKTFNEDFIKTCDQITTVYDNFMFIDDLNYETKRNEAK
jgi:hypothetical protein